MIVSCPGCDATLKVPDSRAGGNIKCPNCGERLEVPLPGKSGSPPRAPERGSGSGPRGAGPRKRARSDREERPRKRAKQGPGVLIACVSGAAVIAVAGLIGILSLSRRAPKEEKPIDGSQARAVALQQSAPQPLAPVSKPAPETNSEPPSTAGMDMGGDDSGQVIYKHLLKSAAWILAKAPAGISAGSGSLIDRTNRLVLTNHHVVGDSKDILVFFPTYRNGKLVAERDAYMRQTREQDLNKGRVLAADKKRDLALVQIERVPDGIEALTLAKTSTGAGQNVHSIGNPLGTTGALWIYTSGTVRQVYHKPWKSDMNTSHEANMVETQVPSNPGDSGGPLINNRGELVGVTQGVLAGAQLVSQSVDVTEATDFIQKTCQANRFAWVRENRLIIAGNAGGVPGLIRSLEHADSKVRGNAVQALGNVGAEAKLAVVPLLKLLATETDALTRRLAVDALNKIGTPDRSDVIALTESLKSDNSEVRSCAASALGKLGPAARSAVPALVKVASDTDNDVRQNAIRALGKSGSHARELVLPVITAALKDPDREVRVAGGDALASLVGFTAADVPMLLEVLKHQDGDVRACGARALGQVGPAAAAALGPLVEAFKGPDKGLRKAAVEALANIGGTPKDLVPIFGECLHDPDKALCKCAALALAKIGPTAKETVPALALLLADSDKELRKNAATALAKIGLQAKDAVSALAEALKEDDKELRSEVLAALAAIGPGAKAALPALIQLFESRDKDTHRKCAQTIGKIGSEAVKPLMTALNQENNLIRIGAAMALGEIGPPAKLARQQLTIRAQNDLDPQVRQVAGSAPIKINAKP